MRLIDYANAPIFGIDTKGRVNEWNRKAVEITGYQRDEVIGKNLVQDFITPDFQASVMEVLDNALQGKGTDNFEFPLYSRDGKKVEVLLNATTRVDAANTPIGVIGVGQDITERKTAEQEVTRLAMDLQRLIDSANAPILGVDRNGLISEWNQNMCKLSGYSKQDVLGIRLATCDFIDVENRASVADVLERALEGHDCQNFEFSIHSKDGRRVELLLNAATRRNAAQAIVGVVGVGQDITEKKYIEKAQINAAKMRASNDAKGNFLASMSHEMRTPLNGVLGMLQLAMSYELPHAVRKNVQNAYMSGEHLLNLVNDILDVSKIEAGKLELETKPFHLTEVFRAAMGIVKPQATSKGLAMELAIAPDLPAYARGDQQRVRQVLLNLLYNAVKFTVRGSVTLSVVVKDTTPTHYCLATSVCDTGIGIDEQPQKKLFGMFTKIKDARVRNPLGVGLGLAICKQLVELMGGSIWVESEYGKGSTFSFTLVVERAESETDIQAVEEESNAQLSLDAQCDADTRPASILVAEDNEFNMEVVKTMLIKMGHSVEIAWDGSECLERLFDANGQPMLSPVRPDRLAYDLIFMDCNMPVMDGYEACTFIRKSEARLGLTPVPIIALTAYAMPGDRDKCLDHGMTDYLTKPMSKQALRKMVSRYTPHGSGSRVDSSRSTPKSLSATPQPAPRRLPAAHPGSRGAVNHQPMPFSPSPPAAPTPNHGSPAFEGAADGGSACGTMVNRALTQHHAMGVTSGSHTSSRFRVRTSQLQDSATLPPPTSAYRRAARGPGDGATGGRNGANGGGADGGMGGRSQPLPSVVERVGGVGDSGSGGSCCGGGGTGEGHQPCGRDTRSRYGTRDARGGQAVVDSCSTTTTPVGYRASSQLHLHQSSGGDMVDGVDSGGHGSGNAAGGSGSGVGSCASSQLASRASSRQDSRDHHHADADTAHATGTRSVARCPHHSSDPGAGPGNESGARYGGSVDDEEGSNGFGEQSNSKEGLDVDFYGATVVSFDNQGSVRSSGDGGRCEGGGGGARAVSQSRADSALDPTMHLGSHLMPRLRSALAKVHVAVRLMDVDSLKQAASAARLVAGYLGALPLQRALGVLLTVEQDEPVERVRTLVETMEHEAALLPRCVEADARDVASRPERTSTSLSSLGRAKGGCGGDGAGRDNFFSCSDASNNRPALASNSPAATAAAASNSTLREAILDYGAALRQLGGDNQLLRRMLLHYISYSRNIPAKLIAAASAGDYEEVRREAHSLKGSASYIGAVAVPRLAHSLQEAAGSADLRTVTGLIGELGSALDALRREAERRTDGKEGEPNTHIGPAGIADDVVDEGHHTSAAPGSKARVDSAGYGDESAVHGGSMGDSIHNEGQRHASASMYAWHRSPVPSSQNQPKTTGRRTLEESMVAGHDAHYPSHSFSTIAMANSAIDPACAESKQGSRCGTGPHQTQCDSQEAGCFGQSPQGGRGSSGAGFNTVLRQNHPLAHATHCKLSSTTAAQLEVMEDASPMRLGRRPGCSSNSGGHNHAHHSLVNGCSGSYGTAYSGRHHAALVTLLENLFSSAEADGCGSDAFRASAERMHACVLLSAAEHDVLLTDGFELLRLLHSLSTGLAHVDEVDSVLRRLGSHTVRSSPTDGVAGAWCLAVDDAVQRRESSYELALKMYCDDPGVLERMKATFAHRSAQLLVRVAEAVLDGNLRRAALEAHSLRGMALYIGNPPIAAAALALETEAAGAAADAVVVEAHLRRLRHEVSTLQQSDADPGGGGCAEPVEAASSAVEAPAPTPIDAKLRAELLINVLARRSIGYAMERLTHAAARLDVDGMRAAALALKQMTLCHGPLFDLLAIAAYRLQQAAASGSARKALAHLAPVADAAAHTTQLLLLEASQPPLLCSLRTAGPGNTSFFSHVIGEHPSSTPGSVWGVLGSANSGGIGENWPAEASHSTGYCVGADLAAPPSTTQSGSPLPLPLLLLRSPPVNERVAARYFSGDAVVLARTITAFVALVPTWLRSVEDAIERLQLLLLRSEAWVLQTTALLIGAHRLAALANGLKLAVDELEPLELLRRRLLVIRAELRLVLAHAAQFEPQVMESEPAAHAVGLAAACMPAGTEALRTTALPLTEAAVPPPSNAATSAVSVSAPLATNGGCGESKSTGMRKSDVDEDTPSPDAAGRIALPSAHDLGPHQHHHALQQPFPSATCTTPARFKETVPSTIASDGSHPFCHRHHQHSPPPPPLPRRASIHTTLPYGMSYHSGSARGVGSAGHSCTPGHGVHGQIADGPVLATPAGGRCNRRRLQPPPAPDCCCAAALCQLSSASNLLILSSPSHLFPFRPLHCFASPL